MKEMHALESASQSDMIENLQDQLVSKAEVNGEVSSYHASMLNECVHAGHTTHTK